MPVAPFVEIDIGDGGDIHDQLARIVETIALDGGLILPGWRCVVAESVDATATVWAHGSVFYVNAPLLQPRHFSRLARSVAYALAVLAGWDDDHRREFAESWEEHAKFQEVIHSGERR